MTPEQVNAEPSPSARLMGMTVTRTDPDGHTEHPQ